MNTALTKETSARAEASETVSKTAEKKAEPGFADLGIRPEILAILLRAGFKEPTPIQGKVIPIGIKGQDVIGIAQTGTGKTLGFGIPIIERILEGKGPGVVILPTRELALQVDETLRKVGGPLGVRTAVLIGGEPIYRQVRSLRYRPDIVIATPGRLIDHLKQKNLSLAHVGIVVLDEADHMFDIGFMPQIREIMAQVSKERQTMLFSATMPDEIAKLGLEHMKTPLRIEVAPQGTAATSVEQEIIIVDRKSRMPLLIEMVKSVTGPVLVFSRTKYGAGDIAHDLRKAGFTATEIHSNRSLGQRRQALDGFKTGKFQILVATDIAARGIDVKGIDLVINYDLPEQTEDYVHRIGRTGRGGATGKAVSFALPDQGRDIRDIERLIKKEVSKKSHNGASIIEVASAPRGRGGRGRGRGGRGFGGGSRGFGGGHASHGASHTGGHASHGGHGGPRRGGFGGRSKYPRPLKTDPSKKAALGDGYRRVFRKGVMR
ncbi:MAG TPA: DEAD/DEAH box helicase [Candidatus Paceibacterota bacterium]